jgi:hypothetical protein
MWRSAEDEADRHADHQLATPELVEALDRLLLARLEQVGGRQPSNRLSAHPARIFSELSLS